MNPTLAVARLKALGDPARLKIVQTLAELPNDHTVFDSRCGTVYGVCFCHLEECLGLSKPTVSHHLKILREAGIIEVIRVGKWSYYRLLPAAIEGMIQDMTGLRPVQKLFKLELAT